MNCGIGIYSTNPKLKLPKNYRDYILELASSSQLAFIISDSSISYGTNLPFNNVIITSDLAKIHSINTIFQIMGRAGRLGISESCNVWIFGEYIKNIFLNYLRNTIYDADVINEAKNILSSMGLKNRLNHRPSSLSGGEQQMLSIGRALARDIKVLLLDEPYEGLAPVIVDEIEKTLNVIKEQGITTVIVEQNAVRALELADRSVILDTGGVVFDGTAKEVLDNSELRAEYLAI